MHAAIIVYTVTLALEGIDGLETEMMNGASACILIDGDRIPESLNRQAANGVEVQSVIGGDRKEISIAAASIIAKVERDRIMVDQHHKELPQYNFRKHKGYGTAEHVQKLMQYGPSSIHRKTYAPVAAAAAAAASKSS